MPEMTELDRMRLERDQAIAALKLILESKADLFTFFEALDAASTLLTRLHIGIQPIPFRRRTPHERAS